MLANERARRWLKFLVALAVSLLFSYFFIRSVDLGEVADALGDADYTYVVPALALFAVSVALRALRWRYFLLPAHDLTWRALLPSVLVGYAGNNLLPLRAGELLRAQYLADHQGVSRMQTFGALVVERLFDGFILAVFVLWGLVLVEAGEGYLGAGLLLLGGALAAAAVCIVLANRPDASRRLARLPLPFLSERRREQVASLGDSFFEGFDALRSASRFSAVMLVTVAAWAFELGMYYVIAEAFALNASFLEVAFAGAAANVSLSLPSAQGGVGPFQLATTKALTKAGVIETAAAAYSLALHIFLIVPVSLVGLVVLWRSTLVSSHRPVATPTALEARD
jgi:uncharacterized protein (TIRG00374 family)